MIKKILAWFIIDYFSPNNDLFAQASKNFRPQNTDDETVLAEQSDYVWDPEWSHESFINIPTDISSQTIGTISIHKDYVRVYSLTIDATPLNYKSVFPERTENNSLNSTFINNDNLNGTRNLTQQEIQTPSHFVSEEIFETITTTEAQRRISLIQPNFTIPKLKNPTIEQTIKPSTVKPSVAQKNSQMDYPTFRPVAKSSYKQQTIHRKNFAEHNYNYVNGPITTKSSNMNTQKYLYSKTPNIPQTTSNSVIYHDQPRSSQEQSENYPFF